MTAARRRGRPSSGRGARRTRDTADGRRRACGARRSGRRGRRRSARGRARVVAHARVLVAERALEQQRRSGRADVRHRADRGAAHRARRVLERPRPRLATTTGRRARARSIAMRRNAASGDVVASRMRARSRGCRHVERAELATRAFELAVGRHRAAATNAAVIVSNSASSIVVPAIGVVERRPRRVPSSMRTCSMSSNSRNDAATAADAGAPRRRTRPAERARSSPVVRRSVARPRERDRSRRPCRRASRRRRRRGSSSGARREPRTRERAAAPAVARGGSGRELLLGPAVARADEPRQRGVVLGRPRALGEEAAELARGAVDERDRHAPERGARHVARPRLRQTRTGDAERATRRGPSARRIVRLARQTWTAVGRRATRAARDSGPSARRGPTCRSP